MLEGFDVKAGLACDGSIDDNRKVLQALGLGGDHFGCARHLLNLLGDQLSRFSQIREVLTIDFDHHVAARTRQHFRNAHLNRLGKRDHDAGKGFEHAAESFNDVFFAPLPICPRF